MTEDNPTWQSDWEARLSARISARGYSSLIEYLHAFPGRPYEDLAQDLGPDVAPIQLLQLHIWHGKQRLEEALDSLTRLLRKELKSFGWGVGPHWRFKVVTAGTFFARWGDDDELHDFLAVLLHTPLPKGWCPDSSNDPHLHQVVHRFGEERLKRALESPFLGADAAE